MTKAFGKYKQFYSFTEKTTDPDDLKKKLENWLSDVTMETDEKLKKVREYIDVLPETVKTSELSVKTTPKAKSFSQISQMSVSRISKTSSRRHWTLFLAKHRCEEIERQNESLLRLAQQKQELHHQRLTQERQRLEQKEDRMRKEQALMLAELHEEKKGNQQKQHWLN